MFHTPEIVREIYRVLLAAKTAAGLPKAGEIDSFRLGSKRVVRAADPINYAWQQDLISRQIESRSCSIPSRARSGASAPIPKFANPGGTLRCELRNQRGTSKFLSLVWFWI
jgi:hypothetical protein